MEDVQIDNTVSVDPNVTSVCSPKIPNFEFVGDVTQKLETVDGCDDSLGDSMRNQKLWSWSKRGFSSEKLGCCGRKREHGGEIGFFKVKKTGV
ncbi:unnamed protein product [Arabidopsis halleri]